VSGAKIKPGSVEGSSFDLETTPYTRVVHLARSTAPVTVREEYSVVPLEAPTYTQATGEDDAFTGIANVSVPPECKGPRRVALNVALDAPNPAKADQLAGEIVSEDSISMPETGAASETASLEFGGWAFAPAAPVNHTLAVVARAECEGTPDTAVVNSVEVMVVGTR
jgi:hypothetical protein